MRLEILLLVRSCRAVPKERENAGWLHSMLGFLNCAYKNCEPTMLIKTSSSYISCFSVVGVDPAINGIGPAVAIPAAVKSADLEISDIDLFEINEAFASQFVYCCKELDLDPEKVNVNGGVMALGHPLGATGTKSFYIRCCIKILHFYFL